MTSAVEGNPTLAAQRQRRNATREALPQSGSRRRCRKSRSQAAQARRTVTPDNGVALDGDLTDVVGECQRPQLLFGGGRVLASTRAAVSSDAGAVVDYELAQQTLLLDVTRLCGRAPGGRLC